MFKAKKTVAILFHGLVDRSLEFTIDSFEKNILKPLKKKYDVDVYHHAWKVNSIHNPRGDENNVLIESDKIERFLPYSQGIEESQEEFDATIDKNFFNKNNPMISCNKTLEGAYITSMNSIRDTESTKRAFEYMKNQKKRRYDYVIVCRPDIDFINKLNVSDIKKKCKKGIILTPYFHAWEGINDRFAIGTYEDIEIYCNRTKENILWQTNGDQKNSEIFLKNYLLSKNIKQKNTPIFFRRIRAGGKIFYQDTVNGNENKVFFILCCFLQKLDKFTLAHLFLYFIKSKNKKKLLSKITSYIFKKFKANKKTL